MKCSSPLSDPLAFGVLYLYKYFGNFINFISHVKSIYLKNISYNCGNTKEDHMNCCNTSFTMNDSLNHSFRSSI
jgi:hypothetical protein